MECHDVCRIFPEMSSEEFTSLMEDIAKHGLHEPIWTHEGKIIDGRHRYRVCLTLHIKPKFREWDGKGSLMAFVVSLNLHRRHLTSGQRATVGVEVEKQLAAEAKKRQKAAGGNRRSKSAEGSLVERIPQAVEPTPKSRDQAAEMVGTNPHYIQDAKFVQRVRPDLFREVQAGKKSLPQAKRLAVASTGPTQRGGVGKPKSEGVGIFRGHEAIDCLKRIPRNDPHRARGFQIIATWIRHNSPRHEGQLGPDGDAAWQKFAKQIRTIVKARPADRDDIFMRLETLLSDLLGEFIAKAD